MRLRRQQSAVSSQQSAVSSQPRTMGTVQVQKLKFEPMAVYFLAAGLLFGPTLRKDGFTRMAFFSMKRVKTLCRWCR